MGSPSDFRQASELKIMLKLRYFPVNSAWSFVFGDAPITLSGFPRFFSDRAEAVRAAEYRGISVSPEGACTSA
jgi:hypothetical protein